VDGERKVDIVISSQTLSGTVDGTIGSVLGLCSKTYAFLVALQRAMDIIIKPVGDLSHAHYRVRWRDETRHGAAASSMEIGSRSSSTLIFAPWIESSAI